MLLGAETLCGARSEACELEEVEVAGEESVVRTVALAESLISQASICVYWLVQRNVSLRRTGRNAEIPKRLVAAPLYSIFLVRNAGYICAIRSVTVYCAVTGSVVALDDDCAVITTVTVEIKVAIIGMKVPNLDVLAGTVFGVKCESVWIQQRCIPLFNAGCQFLELAVAPDLQVDRLSFFSTANLTGQSSARFDVLIVDAGNNVSDLHSGLVGGAVRKDF